ncbi:oxalocrotonate tautomerase [Penicillium cinerascens]|uniref:Oxalocrotonate tautomerase n=1 Tax=Penicillium cinerascens TaxID=70096 RepID=A0A9W9J646_9EURO|nr:oxalocrotonate tautomerase [Penicillium cinerascens]KAJ5190577.1 oxalocrotonate tautomerase [Penicillium cinerascens]
MPLWQIYHPNGTFEDPASKEAFVQDITKMYTDVGLPAFYVVVNFVTVSKGDIFVGGKVPTERPFIRVVITHIAVHAPNEDAAYRRITSRIDTILKPHVADKGYDWEYHVDETERRLWKLNGMIPPPHKSESERVWAKENRAVDYDGAY